MFTVGLEKEFFCLKEGEVCVVPSPLPADNCGWLIEARGNPYRSPREAIFSLKGEVDRIEKLAVANGIELAEEPILKVPKDVRIAARRRFDKGRVTYQNLYGWTAHRNRITGAVASTRVTMRQESVYPRDKGADLHVGTLFDFPRIIRYLDDEFEEEIKASRRRPGFYEMKSNGMVEYRSLPNYVCLDKLLEVLEEAVKLA